MHNALLFPDSSHPGRFGKDTAMATHTPGPWNYERSGDGKRISVGLGLVEGPNGYDVAEVYSDDCDGDVAMANARLIAASPDLLALAYQYRDDLRYPPTGDSIARRLDRVNKLLAAFEGATCAECDGRGRIETGEMQDGPGGIGFEAYDCPTCEGAAR